TTGGSFREAVEPIAAAGGEVLCCACIVDRSGGRADVGFPLVALATLDVPAYPADNLPPELAALTRRRGRPLNLEMAVTPEMEAIALAHRPHAACLVPERREEVTTEGGLDVAGGHNRIAPLTRRFTQAGIRVSCFIDADLAQVAAAKAVG